MGSREVRLVNAGLAGDCGEGVVYVPMPGLTFGMIRVTMSPELPPIGYLMDRHDLVLELENLLKENAE